MSEIRPISPASEVKKAENLKPMHASAEFSFI